MDRVHDGQRRCGDRAEEQKEILTSVKDAYGCPYVPGSSLKGALRTVLLGAVVIRKNEAFAEERKNCWI